MTDHDKLREQARTYLEGLGLTDRPEEYGDGIHRSWRCEHPDRYGRCTCLEEAAEDLAKLLAAERAAALREAAEDRFYDQDQDRAIPGYWMLIDRADQIEKETPDA